MGYQAAPLPPSPPPRCCRDEMVPIERIERRLFGLLERRIVTGWCCVWCDRIADAGEPERQRLARWLPPRTEAMGALPPSRFPDSLVR